MAIFFVLLIATAWFLRGPLGEKAAAVMRDQLAAQGIHLSWEKAALQPGLGVRFEGLTLHGEASRETAWFHWDGVTVRKGRSGWTSVQIHANGSRLSLGKTADDFVIEDLDVDLHLTRAGLELDQLEGRFTDLAVSVSGQLEMAKLPSRPAVERAADSVASDQPEQRRSAGLSESLLSGLRNWLTVKAGAEKPLLHLQVSPITEGVGHEVTAMVDGSRFEWRSQEIADLGLTAAWNWDGKPQPIRFTRLTMDRKQTGQIANLSLDLEKGFFEVIEIDTWLVPLAILQSSYPQVQDSLKALQLDQTIRLRGRGKFPFGTLNEAVFSGSVAAPGRTRWELTPERNIVLENLRSDVALNGGMLQLKETRAVLWEGAIHLPATEISWSEGLQWRADLQAQGVQAGAMAVGLGMETDRTGVIQFAWSGGGSVALESLKGQGNLIITDASFYRLPLLGPLHLIFDRLAPGFARDTASRLETDYSLERGQLSLRNLSVQSRFTEISAEGSVNLTKDYAKLTAEARLRGLASLPTALVSQLLTLEGEGPTAAMTWRLRNVPGLEQVFGAAGLAGDVLIKASDSAGGIIQGAGSAAGGILQGAGDAAGGVIRGAGSILGLPGRLFQREEKKPAEPDLVNPE